MGKEHSKGLCAKFKDKCETKIADRECKFGPKQFESGNYLCYYIPPLKFLFLK